MIFIAVLLHCGYSMILGEMHLSHNSEISLLGTSCHLCCLSCYECGDLKCFPDNLLTFKLIFTNSVCEFPCECGHTDAIAGGERSENFMELGTLLLPLDLPEKHLVLLGILLDTILLGIATLMYSVFPNIWFHSKPIFPPFLCLTVDKDVCCDLESYLECCRVKMKVYWK